MFTLRYFKRCLLLTTGLAALALSHLQAGAKFSGATGYQIVKEGASVSLEADYIENSSRENATGTLMMKLWALDAPYKGGTLNGTLLGSYKLEGLAGGKHYTDLKRIVPLSTPSSLKNYFICLTLSEFSNGAFGIVDWRNMPNTKLLGPAKLFQLDGPWGWQTSYEGGTVDISVAKISHRRTGRTGSLKLSVWATQQPYRGGSIRGYEIGTIEKKALEAGYTYTNVKNVAKFVPPPNGNYYVNLVLTEFRDNQYVIVDYLPASKLSTFNKR